MDMEDSALTGSYIALQYINSMRITPIPVPNTIHHSFECLPHRLVVSRRQAVH